MGGHIDNDIKRIGWCQQPTHANMAPKLKIHEETLELNYTVDQT